MDGKKNRSRCDYIKQKYLLELCSIFAIKQMIKDEDEC